MSEASLLYDGESWECSKDDLSVQISEFPSSITSVENEAVMAAPMNKPERRSKSSKNSKKACLEDQILERMRASIESHFSSFEEKMLGLMADFQKQKRTVNACLTTSSVTYNVCAAKRSMPGACLPKGTRIHSLGVGNGRSNVISLDNSLNDEYLASRSPMDTQSNVSEIQRAEDDTSDRFLKYKSDENVSEETHQI